MPYKIRKVRNKPCYRVYIQLQREHSQNVRPERTLYCKCVFFVDYKITKHFVNAFLVEKRGEM